MGTAESGTTGRARNVPNLSRGAVECKAFLPAGPNEKGTAEKAPLAKEARFPPSPPGAKLSR
jgi:hypothetical protein